MSPQLTLFDEAPVPGPDQAHAAALQRVHDEARQIAARLPPHVHFGTSSWSFPGWRGIVYSSTRTQTALAREGLRESRAAPAADNGRRRSKLLRADSNPRPSGICGAAARGIPLLLQGPGRGHRPGTGRAGPAGGEPGLPLGRSARLRPAGAVRGRLRGAHRADHPGVPAISATASPLAPRLPPAARRLSVALPWVSNTRSSFATRACSRRRIARSSPATASRTPTTTGARCRSPPIRRRSFRRRTCHSP